MLVVIGLAIAAIGLLAATGALSWFGRLPGDIRWEGAHVRVFVPIVSMLLLSIVLSLVAYLVQRFF